ncbi:hypothetical protein HGQ17_00740 [Nesterenkonia sp. MY13]|uniref:Uncharacterized protein n=1 Tax=Nesterenkonia sedimenti TaxID=1463632 RepID=A0A7X8TH28_9MICC|nr:ATP-binding protein [Nesterenkonia sedimenti]NLS08556.1 hypothetical protein [Nesterenkonia sedimenti]
MSQRSPFIGRDEELSRIEEAVEAVRNGETRFVVVEGITGSAHNSVVSLFLGHTAEVSEPVITSVADMHHMDEVSADTFWQALSVMDRGPMIFLLSVCPTDRPEINRIIQLAQVHPKGLYLPLAPLSVREIQEVISGITELPVSQSVAQRVLARTDGFPRYVCAVARWLQNHPVGQRGIDRAIDEVLDDDESHSFQLSLAASVGAEGPLRRALRVLAVELVAVVIDEDGNEYTSPSITVTIEEADPGDPDPTETPTEDPTPTGTETPTPTDEPTATDTESPTDTGTPPEPTETTDTSEPSPSPSDDGAQLVAPEESEDQDRGGLATTGSGLTALSLLAGSFLLLGILLLMIRRDQRDAAAGQQLGRNGNPGPQSSVRRNSSRRIEAPSSWIPSWWNSSVS